MKEKDKKKKKNKDRKKQRSGASYSESVRAKWFSYAFKLGFVICKASLILKSSLELALSILLKEKELYEPKHVVVEYKFIY